MRRQAHKADEKPPLLWTGIIFALAANLLLVRLTNILVEQWQPGRSLATLAITLAPLVAGILTTFYVRQRGGMHAFIGGMISIPILALFIIPGLWQTALLCGAFCTLGGALTELVTRRRALK